MMDQIKTMNDLMVEVHSVLGDVQVKGDDIRKLVRLRDQIEIYLNSNDTPNEPLQEVAIASISDDPPIDPATLSEPKKGPAPEISKSESKRRQALTAKNSPDEADDIADPLPEKHRIDEDGE